MVGSSTALTTALPTMGSLTGLAYETASGAGFGAADSVLSNGFQNLQNGKNFGANAASAAELGAEMGAGTGALSGFIGRAVTIQSRRALNPGGPAEIELWCQDGGSSFGHIKTSFRSIGNQEDGIFDLVGSRGAGQTDATLQRFDEPPPLFNGYRRTPTASKSIIPADYHAGLAKVRNPFAGRVRGPNGQQTMPGGNYIKGWNDCTTYSREILYGSGISAPLWAKTPSTLKYWYENLR